MLNTYITRIKNVEKNKVKQYLNYLNDLEHTNHNKTNLLGENIEIDTFYKMNYRKIVKNKENYIKRARGGRVLKYSNKTLTFNIPNKYEITNKQLLTIQSMLLDRLVLEYSEKGFKIDKNEFYTNIHEQQNPHINFIIPYLTKEGNTIPFIRSKDFFYIKMSKEFTKIVDKVLNTNINNYISENDFFSKYENILNKDIDFNKKIELLEQMKNKSITKHQKNLIIYTIRSLKGVLEENNKKIEDNQRRIDKLLNSKFEDIYKTKLQTISRKLSYSDLIKKEQPTGPKNKM